MQNKVDVTLLGEGDDRCWSVENKNHGKYMTGDDGGDGDGAAAVDGCNR